MPSPQLRPGAWLGRAAARLLRPGLPRQMFLNALTPAERLELVAEALAWGGLGPDEAPQAARIAHGLAAASDPVQVALGLVTGAASDQREEIVAGAWRASDADDRSLAYALRLYTTHHRHITRWAGGLEGRRILELGPGYSLVPALLLVAAGAAGWTGVDPFPLVSLAPPLYRGLLERLRADLDLVRGPGHAEQRERLLQRLAGLLTVDERGARVDERRVRYLSGAPAEALPLPDASQDVVLSNAVLEHVRDPRAVVAEGLRVLAPGGVGIHQIDLRDHRDFARPLEFLCEDAVGWERRFEAPGERFEYTNRWRASDWVGAFEARGAEVLERRVTLTTPVSAELRRGLSPEFARRDAADLEALSLLLVVRR